MNSLTVPEKDQERAVISLDGNHLSLIGAKLKTFPSFKHKKHNDKVIIEFITSIDASVNKLMYVRNFYISINLKVAFLIYIK